MSGQKLYFSKNWNLKEYNIKAYMASGGYEGLRMALKMDPKDIIETLKKANLRGRGGAGFPTGVKWSFMNRNSGKQQYLVVNSDEGEPGTFKDRYIMERDPHQLVEGMIIAGYTLGCTVGYNYIRGELVQAIACMDRAVQEAREAGFLGRNILGSGFDFEIYNHPGAGAYICGEETALIESIEGKKGQPRMKPPFPAAFGVFGMPTTVNNTETVSAVPHIIREGVDEWNKYGSPKAGGTKLYCISGHVKRPGVYELNHNITLKEIIHDVCGGIRDGKQLKAVIPGGASVPVVRANELDFMMDFDDPKRMGTMLGTGAVMVMDETVCMVRSLLNLLRFYHHESCGQCTPCREGTGWLEKVVRRIEEGNATREDVDMLWGVANNIEGNTICALGDAAAWPTKAFVTKFKEEFYDHVEKGRCPFDPIYRREPARTQPGPYFA
ncbi:MAG: NADH-quinone oxidoreductase subunit F [Myxococcota bacterium]|nr:NADH-quinone oxidoreductase subunit F [Myxococcota bacterium]